MSKPLITTDESVAGALFAELCNYNNDAAMEILWAKYLDRKGLLTPSMRVYIASVEWDAKYGLVIKFMMKESFRWIIWTAGSALDGDGYFCFKDGCSVALHKKSLVAGEPNRWYIQAGNRSTDSYFSRPSLPSVENGGPIPKNYKAQMRDPWRPSFVDLTLGQWRFLFYDWVSSRVETHCENDE